MTIEELQARLAGLSLERRYIGVEELRVDGEGDTPKIRGYAAVFNSLSEDLGGFREQIAPGAFKRTIKSADVRALWNHDPNYVLGRTRSKTLSLAEDDHGLAIEIDPPDTQWARDLMVSIRRKDITQMSFAFQTLKDEWDSEDQENEVRTLVKVRLFDVSPVTYPAYTATDVEVKSGEDVLKEHRAAKSRADAAAMDEKRKGLDQAREERERKLRLLEVA